MRFQFAGYVVLQLTADYSSCTEFKPGDIFACYGRDLVSLGISAETSLTSWLTGPSGLRWAPSHVAIASQFVRSTEITWYESTTLSDRKCLTAEQRVEGVQVHPIRERIRDYCRSGGWVDVYRLTGINELSGYEAELLRSMLSKLVGDKQTGQAPRQYDTSGAVFSGTRLLKWLPFSRANLQQMFCSELIAAVLQRLCRMNRDNPARYNPGLLLRRLVRQGTYFRRYQFTGRGDR